MPGTLTLRKMWLTLLLILAMNIFLWMAWWGTCAMYVAVQASHDPALAKQLEQFRATYQTYQTDADNQTDSDAERYAEAMQPLFASVNWYAASAISSVLAFGVLGIVAGRMRFEPRWLGALPVLALLGGQNPAILPTIMESQGLPGKALNLPQQVSIFAIQMMVVGCTGLLARRPPKPVVSEDDSQKL